MTIPSGPNEATYPRESTRFSVANDVWATLSDGVNCIEACCTDRSAEGFGIFAAKEMFPGRSARRFYSVLSPRGLRSTNRTHCR